MIVFQVSLNFDPVKGILKIQCQICFNAKSDYSEENEHFLLLLFLIHFSLSLNIKKTCGNDSHEKKLNIFTFSCRFITY